MIHNARPYHPSVASQERVAAQHALLSAQRVPLTLAIPTLANNVTEVITDN